MKPSVLLYIIALVLSGCVTQTHHQALHNPAQQNDNLNSTLWMQTAAEFYGNSRSVYAASSHQLANIYEQRNITASIEQAEKLGCSPGISCNHATLKQLPPAIVLDIDETVLDNTVYQARLIKNNRQWSAASWDIWIADKQASPIPGAKDFIQLAKQHKYSIIYITNRRCSVRSGSDDPCPQKQDTLDNMRALGFPDLGKSDLLLLQNQIAEWDSSEKRKRREYVATKYRIAMLIGDDLGDLAPDVKKLSIDKRYELVKHYKFLYGKSWYQLANPGYGSWMNLFKGKNKYDFLEIN